MALYYCKCSYSAHWRVSPRLRWCAGCSKEAQRRDIARAVRAHLEVQAAGCFSSDMVRERDVFVASVGLQHVHVMNSDLKASLLAWTVCLQVSFGKVYSREPSIAICVS